MEQDGSDDLAVSGAMITNPGLVRPHNEDFVLYRIPEPGDAIAAMGMLALVADGMGGHAAGEVASEVAGRALHFLYYQGGLPTADLLRRCFRAANRVVHSRASSNPEWKGMGTTCSAIVIHDNLLWLGHVGDSRIYILRDHALHQLSEDHSLVANFVRDGLLSPEQAKTSPERGVILRALGIHPDIEPQVWSEGMPLREGDIIMLCSDGLCDLVDDIAIGKILADADPMLACEELVRAALAGGGHDNISVGVFHISARQKVKEPSVLDTVRINVAALHGTNR